MWLNTHVNIYQLKEYFLPTDDTVNATRLLACILSNVHLLGFRILVGAPGVLLIYEVGFNRILHRSCFIGCGKDYLTILAKIGKR